MYLHSQNVILVAVCLLFTTAYSPHEKESTELLISENENIQQNKEDSNTNVKNNIPKLNSKDAKETDSNLSTILYDLLLANKSPLAILNISYFNTESAFEILKTSTNFKADYENKTKETTENSKEAKVGTEKDLNGAKTMSNLNNNTDNTSTNNSTTNEIILSDITNLSQEDGEELVVGQKIVFQRSDSNSDTETLNPAGMEILKDVTNFCGSLFGKRISFANETTLMEFPWTVLLLYNTRMRYHCGGSLITKKYVLTAAHCVTQEFYELSGVRLGEYDVTKERDCAPDLVGQDICATTIDVDVVKIIVHHAYSHLSFKNDIALLKLDNEYLSRSFYPICLPTPEKMYSDTKATVAGWGATEKSIRSDVLLKADVPILDISKCREVYRYSVFNDSTEICGSGVNEIDVCKGDSGGALFYKEHVKGKEKFYQLGIISLGVRRCGDSRFLPAVFTKLKGFYKWI